MFSRLATSSIALAALAAPALSEITPAEVWDQMIAENADVGIIVTEGNREEAGDTLTITDAVFSDRGHGSSMEMTMPKLVLNQTGDGNVRWTVEGDITGSTTQSVPGEAGEGDVDIVVPFTIAMPGNETVTSGSVDDLTHDFKSDSIAITVDIPVEDSTLPLAITLDGVEGTQRSAAAGSAGGREISFDMTVASAKGVAEGDLPSDAEAGSASMAFDYGVNDIAMTGQFAMPAGEFDLETQMEEALQAGMQMAMDLTFAGGEGSFTFAGTDPDGVENSGEGTSSSGPGQISFAMSGEGLRYSGGAEASENSMTVNYLPFPIRYGMDKADFDFAIPLLPSEEPAPFKLMTSIAGLTLNDEVWSLFDPGAQLPRDPADMNIDVTGELLVSESFLGGQAAPDLAEMPVPPQPLKVTINDISLNAVGAQASVQGELTAPEGGSMTEAPVGTITGEFTDIEALMTTLGAMGLIPQEQMMGARMMLTMFARPVEGEPGKLATELEFREDGSIFANGQQVK